MKALVLSGGGSRGAFQVGVLNKLQKENPDLDYDIYSGISVGALNSSLLATGKLSETLPELNDIWMNKVTGNKSIWKHRLLRGVMAFIVMSLAFCALGFISFILSWPSWVIFLSFILMLLNAPMVVGFMLIKHFPKNKSIYNTYPLEKLINKYLNLNKLKTSGKILSIGAVSYNTGNYKSVLQDNKDIVKWIMASSAFPVFFPMVEIDDEYWIDGGVSETVPLNDAIKLGATEIDVILASPINMPTQDDNRLLQQIIRSIEIMSADVMANDIVYTGSAKVRIIAPKEPFKHNPLQFKPNEIREMYNSEYEIVKVN